MTQLELISPTDTAPRPPAIVRWWCYQRERFPLLAHGPLIAAFSFCAVALSSMLRGEPGLPRPASIGVAFVTCLLLFLQLRIADEFKDFDEDARWRPYRAVPRGLVSLRELGVLFAIAAAVQLSLALWLEPRLVVLLLITWAYLAAMTKEFFVRRLLEPRPLVYLVSHMLIMPLIDGFATGADWLVAGAAPPAGLAWFLAASFFNGMSLDVGRKIRHPADEEPGVRTYSRHWGRPRAVLAWWALLALTFACALPVASRVGAVAPVAAILGALLLACAAVGGRFLATGAKGAGRWLESMSALWTLALYLCLGALPLIIRMVA